MKLGVVYKFKQHKKINGTLFYCFEYFQQIRQLHDNVKFYIVGATEQDLELVRKLFQEKYTASTDGIEIVSNTTYLYNLKLDRTLILDAHTFEKVREFLHGDVHVYSNREQELWRYKNGRQVTYYGSYDYQPHDVYCRLKLKLDIFRPRTQHTSAVFVSALDQSYIGTKTEDYQQRFPKPVIMKRNNTGSGNIFDIADHIHYVHTDQDPNNRIIVEAFHYGVPVTIDEEIYSKLDSVRIRYNELSNGQIQNYTLTNDDVMVKAMTNE
jgi:hypothetical protein